MELGGCCIVGLSTLAPELFKHRKILLSYLRELAKISNYQSLFFFSILILNAPKICVYVHVYAYTYSFFINNPLPQSPNLILNLSNLQFLNIIFFSISSIQSFSLKLILNPLLPLLSLSTFSLNLLNWLLLALTKLFLSSRTHTF